MAHSSSGSGRRPLKAEITGSNPVCATNFFRSASCGAVTFFTCPFSQIMFEIERNELVKKIRARGITDENALDAIGKVERHLFVPDVMKHHAYKDAALPIGRDQTISQPFTVAFQTQALKLKKGDKALEIGTGSGYQAAVLSALGVKVYSIERDYDLYQNVQKLFDKLQIRAALRCADGTLGWSEYAPYDGIIVTAGAPSVPEALKKQLAIGGRLVIPVGDKYSQTMFVITKLSDDEFETEKFEHFKFVPLIGKEGWKE